jgi:DNA-binding response OmpR family regulator
MNVLIYDPSQTEGPRLLALLKERNVPASIAHDPMRLLAMTKQDRIDLVLLCTQKFAPELMGVAENLRTNHILEPSQIQLVTGPLDDADGTHAFESGIDSILPWGCDAEYLAARVAAVGRVLERCERKVGAPPFKPGGDGVADMPLRIVCRSNAWRTAPEKMREVVGQFLSQAATNASIGFDAAPPVEKAASILLTSGTHAVQIRIAVGADEKSALLLAGKIFGPDAKDLVDDMFGEVANVVMGAMKNHFSAEQLAFTGGLPTPLAPRELTASTTPFAHRHLFALDIGGARLTMHLGMQTRQPLSVNVTELREGMVIARDLVNERGMLLLKGGTRLSTTMINKLTDLLPPRLPIQVTAS